MHVIKHPAACRHAYVCARAEWGCMHAHLLSLAVERPAFPSGLGCSRQARSMPHRLRGGGAVLHTRLLLHAVPSLQSHRRMKADNEWDSVTAKVEGGHRASL